MKDIVSSYFDLKSQYFDTTSCQFAMIKKYVMSVYKKDQR